VSVDRFEVARIARLARLDFDEEGAERMAADLSRILDYAERLREVAGEPNDPGPVEDGGVGVRDPALDAPDPLLRGPERFAPAWQDDFFVVPPPPGVAADGDEG